MAAAMLVFTPSDYNVAQNVVVTGQDDSVVAGAVSYDVKVTSSQSADPQFDGLETILVMLRNFDND